MLLGAGCGSASDPPTADQTRAGNIELNDDDLEQLTARCHRSLEGDPELDPGDVCDGIVEQTRNALEAFGCDVEVGLRSIDAQLEDPLNFSEAFDQEPCVRDG